MSALIDSIIETRKISGDIAAKALINILGFSEIEIKEKLLAKIKKNNKIFPEGYYSPPPFGVAILLDERPFNRFRYDSLRNPEFWPKEDSHFRKESVGMMYFSPVNRETCMIGDIGITFYIGNDEEIKKHIKIAYDTLLEIARYTEVGMKFSDICKYAKNLLESKSLKATKWTAVNSDPNQTMNFGHTIPGSFENNLSFGNTFGEIKETIRTKRVPFIDTENFQIPKTCAFTVESRLEDSNNPNLPSVHFHFIVCFDEGKKIILDNFEKIFKVMGMDYIYTK